MDEKYWRSLISMVTRTLSDEGSVQAAYITKNGNIELRWSFHDNWDGGIDYYDLVFHLKYEDYLSVESQKEKTSEEIKSTLLRFYNDERNIISNILIEPVVERIIDWKAILPEGKVSTIRLIEEERDQLLANATGRQSYKEPGVEQEYELRHEHIVELASRAGFDYPVPFNTLAEWWVFIKSTDGYAARTAQVNRMFENILIPIRASKEDVRGSAIDFGRIVHRTEAIRRALFDAQVLIKNGSFSSTTDRIHTAFHSYLRQLLDEHGVAYIEKETLSQLYTKLHNCYSTIIHPEEVADLVKTAIRGGSGIVSSINDIRNRHTVSHPNPNLIKEREAKLVISLVRSLVDYIEDVESSFSK